MKRFQNILVPLDTRFENHPALEWAVQLAEQSGAKIKIVDIVPDFSWIQRLVTPDADNVHRLLDSEKQQKLDDLATPLKQRGIDVTTKVLDGKSSREIINEVTSGGHDLVVRVTKGTHSQQTGLFGTTSLRLLRNCPCAVWLVRPDVSPKFVRVLAAIDPAPEDPAHQTMNKNVMELGMAVADAESGEFHVVHAWNLMAANALQARLTSDEYNEVVGRAESEVKTAMDAFLAPYNLSHESDRVHLLCDPISAGHGIAALAKQQQVDLIVMGTIARSGLAGALLGNTAERVLDQTECPVVAIKP